MPKRMKSMGMKGMKGRSMGRDRAKVSVNRGGGREMLMDTHKKMSGSSSRSRMMGSMKTSMNMMNMKV